MNIKRFYFPIVATIFTGLGLAALVPAWVIDRNETELLFGFIQTAEPQIYLQLSIGTLALSASAINQEGYSRVVACIITAAAGVMAIVGLPGLLTAQSEIGLKINWAGELLYLTLTAAGAYLIISKKFATTKK